MGEPCGVGSGADIRVAQPLPHGEPNCPTPYSFFYYCLLKMPPKDQRSNTNRQFTLITGNRNLETWSNSLKSFKILFWVVSFLLLAWTGF